MSPTNTRHYYDERYGAERGDAFPFDPSRYRAWFGSLLAEQRPGARFLDYGCGVGYVCSLFADLGYDATGLDISSAAIAIASEREPRAAFLSTGENGTLPFDDGTFDLVASLGVIEHISDPVPVVAELRRIVNSDGRAIWVVPNSRSPFFWFGHGTEQEEETPRSLEDWRALLSSAGWQVTSVRRDPGPIDRRVRTWKRVGQAVLNRLPLALTYQFVIETRPDDRTRAR